MSKSLLEDFVEEKIEVICTDARIFVGTLKGFDQAVNLVARAHWKSISPILNILQKQAKNEQTPYSARENQFSPGRNRVCSRSSSFSVQHRMKKGSTGAESSDFTREKSGRPELL